MRWSPIYSDWLSSTSDEEPSPVEDVAALEQAERAVRGFDPLAANGLRGADWVEAFKPARVGGYLINPGANAFLIANQLDAASITYIWDPYPPQLMPMYRPGSGAVDRPFSLLVAPEDYDDATALLAELGFKTSDWSAFSAPVTPQRSEDAEYYRLVRFFCVMALFYIPQLVTIFLSPLYVLASLLPAPVRAQLHRWFG